MGLRLGLGKMHGLAFVVFKHCALIPVSALTSVAVCAAFVPLLDLAWPLSFLFPHTWKVSVFRPGLIKAWGTFWLSGRNCNFSLRVIHWIQSCAERDRYDRVMYPMPMQTLWLVYCVCIFISPRAAWLPARGFCSWGCRWAAWPVWPGLLLTCWLSSSGLCTAAASSSWTTHRRRALCPHGLVSWSTGAW